MAMCNKDFKANQNSSTLGKDFWQMLRQLIFMSEAAVYLIKIFSADVDPLITSLGLLQIVQYCRQFIY